MGGEKGKVQVLITEGDDIQAKARDFCTEHGLNEKAYADVVQSMQVLLKEARVRGEAQAEVQAEMQKMDSHYWNAIGAFLGLVLVVKVLLVAGRYARSVHKRHMFEKSHAKKMDFQQWDDTTKPAKTKTGKNGNKSSGRKQAASATAVPSKPKKA